MLKTMKTKPVRLLIVASIAEGHAAIEQFLSELKQLFSDDAGKFEIAGVAYNKRTAMELVDSARPDLLLVDLMLPALRSIEIISHASAVLPDAKILALSPGDAPYDRVILALQAGALGFVCKDIETTAIFSAIKDVLRGKLHLPSKETYDVLQQSASSLSVSARERRDGFYQILLSFIPMIGIIAAFISYMWREYWGQIGVRVTDLGVDASARVPEFLVLGLVLFGIFGPIIFIDTWLELIKRLEAGQKIHNAIDKLRMKQFSGISIGKMLFGVRSIRLYSIIIIISFTMAIEYIGGKIIIITIGEIIAIILLLHIMSLEYAVPAFLRISGSLVRPAVATIGTLVTVLIFVLSIEVFIRGPDLRADGLHGFLAPTVLDLSARPAMIYDLHEKREPLGALYLGGNADLYVLYDPCEKVVRFIPVGSARVELINKVQCASR